VFPSFERWLIVGSIVGDGCFVNITLFWTFIYNKRLCASSWCRSRGIPHFEKKNVVVPRLALVQQIGVHVIFDSILSEVSLINSNAKKKNYKLSHKQWHWLKLHSLSTSLPCISLASSSNPAQNPNPTSCQNSKSSTRAMLPISMSLCYFAAILILLPVFVLVPPNNFGGKMIRTNSTNIYLESDLSFFTLLTQYTLCSY
jgi:hypothetical protein